MPPKAKTNTNNDNFAEYAKIRAAKAWRPEPGDIVKGNVIKVVGRTSDFGVYPVAIIDDNSGEYVAVHMFHHLLRQQAKDVKLSSGDEVSIAYMGRVASTKRKDDDNKPVKYHNYILMANGVESDTEYVWDSEDDTPGF